MNNYDWPFESTDRCLAATNSYINTYVSYQFVALYQCKVPIYFYLKTCVWDDRAQIDRPESSFQRVAS